MHARSVLAGLSVLLAASFAAYVLLFLLLFRQPAQQFSAQAQSFIAGRLDVPYGKTADFVVAGGRTYWPQGPFPSVFLIPFQLLFGPGFDQGWGQALVGILVFTGSYVLARSFGHGREDSLFLTGAFMFGSVLAGILIQPSSWFFAQSVAVLLLVFLILAWKRSAHPLAEGIITALILATRPTAAAFGLVILSDLVRDMRQRHRDAALRLLCFLLPIAVSVLLLGWLNVMRYGSFLDNGYWTNAVHPAIAALRANGLFSPVHIPANAVWYFLALPHLVRSGHGIAFPFLRYDDWGLSLFIVSPFFWYAMFRRPTFAQLRSLWVVTVSVMVVLLAYYTPGWVTFGPRYAADVMPLVFTAVLYGLRGRRVTAGERILILGSMLFNAFLLWSTRIAQTG